jgi:acetyl esterase/lipase
MIYKVIDLYNYFNIKKNGDLQGFLHIYALENQKEVNQYRKYSGMLIIPGGGYEFCSSREMEPVALKLLTNCVQCFALEYSCGKDVCFPTQLVEGYLALKYIQENEKEFNLRENRIGVLGFSAGAHLAGLLSNSYKKDEMWRYGINTKINKPYLSCFIYPVVSSNKKIAHYPSFLSLTKGDEEMIDDLSLENLITKDSPRSFIMSSFEDSSVPCINSLLLATKLYENGVNTEIHVFSRGEHGLSLGDETVFNTNKLNEVTKTNSKWFELLINYLLINDFKIED